MVFSHESQLMLIPHDELRSAQNFLRDMQDMLHIAQDNIKMTQDRAQFYAVHNREPRVFNPRQKVFLPMPPDSKKLSTGKCVKLAPRFCEPLTILKLIGSSAFCLALSNGVEIHPVFHVSSLRLFFGSGENTITTETLNTMRFSF